MPEEFHISKSVMAFLLAQMIKNLPAVQEIWVWSLGNGSSSGEGDGNSFQHLAWGIPWTEEPGGLQFMGWQRVVQDWVTNTFTFKNVTKVKIFLLLMPKIWSRPCHRAGWIPTKLSRRNKQWNSCVNCLGNQEVDLWPWLKVKVWEALERKRVPVREMAETASYLLASLSDKSGQL